MNNQKQASPSGSALTPGMTDQIKARFILRMLIISAVTIFVIESILMYLFEIIFTIPKPMLVLLDGFVLAIVLLPLNYLFVVRPMTILLDQRNQTNQELIKSNQILERFFSISDVLIAYLDRDFNFLRVNKAYADSDQRSPSDFVGKNHFDLFPNEENLQIFKSVVETGKPFYVLEKPFEYAEHPERGVSYWDWSLLPVKGPDEKVMALILVLSDVTLRKMAQKALEENERRFRAVFNQTFQHIGLLNPDGEIILFNQTALDFTATTAEELTGQPLWQLPWWVFEPGTRPEDCEDLEAAIRQAAGGQVVRCEHRIRSLTGSPAVMDITIKPLLDENRSTILLIYEARDITERIQAGEALKNQQEEISHLYQAEKLARQRAETLRSAVLALSRSLDTNTVLQTLLDHLYVVVSFSSAHIYLLDDPDHLVVSHAWGEEDWEQEHSLLGKRFDISSSPLLQTLLEKKESLSIPDTTLFPGLEFLPNDRYIRSWLGIPLLAGDQTIGACILEYHCPNFFSDELVNWASALSSQASVAIQNAWLFEQVRDGREHLQALSRQLVETQENERYYIAQELHDEAGQALTSLMIGLRQLERENASQPAILARSQELKQIADSVLEDLHRLAINLRPATLDHLGLVAALRQHAESISMQHGITVQFETVGKIDRLPGDMETAIYRIVQEALTNVIRHAKASRVDILLERRDPYLVVVVEDNGIGFDPHTPYISHLGVLGMRERANMLGGVITIESTPGKGSTIFLEVPCPYES